jgi:hypothetical protein
MEIVNKEQKLQRLIDKGYDFNMEKYFSEGWALFRKIPGMLILYTLIVFVISGILGSIEIFGSLFTSAIGPILGAGYFVVFRKMETTEKIEFGDFFKSFDDFVQLVILGVVVSIITVIGLILLVLPGIWFAVGTSFATMLVVLFRLEFWDAITYSVKIVNKKWFHFFALIILIVLLNVAGAIALGVGLFITIPMSYGVIYACCRDIVGVGKGENLDAADHLVGDQY